MINKTCINMICDIRFDTGFIKYFIKNYFFNYLLTSVIDNDY